MSDETTRGVCMHCGEPTDAGNHVGGYCYCGDRLNQWLLIEAEPSPARQAHSINCIHCPHVLQYHLSGVLDGTKRGCTQCGCPGFEAAQESVWTPEKEQEMLEKAAGGVERMNPNDNEANMIAAVLRETLPEVAPQGEIPRPPLTDEYVQEELEKCGEPTCYILPS